MIVSNTKRNIIKSDLSDKTYNFRIGNESIIFDMLIKKLYSNPLYTVVREYLQNARDAHREAGKEDIPIEIKLPTLIDNYFSIKDFGVGLSPQRIKDVFIVFGESTKKNNYEHGGFGIGATSVWTYTDFIIIESIYNGVKYTYSGYMNSEGIPVLDVISKEKVAECNSVLIKFAIKQDDIKKVEKYIERITFFWPIKPKILNPTYTHQGLLLNDIKFDFEYKNVFFIPQDLIRLFNTNILLLYDGIPYDIQNILNFIYNEEIDLNIDVSKFKYIYDKTLIICAKVNDVDISLNREEIKINNKSVSFVVNSINSFAKYCLKKVEDDLTDYIENYKYSGNFGTLGNYISHAINNISFLKERKFNSKELNDIVSIITSPIYKYLIHNGSFLSYKKYNFIYADNVYLIKYEEVENEKSFKAKVSRFMKNNFNNKDGRNYFIIFVNNDYFEILKKLKIKNIYETFDEFKKNNYIKKSEKNDKYLYKENIPHKPIKELRYRQLSSLNILFDFADSHGATYIYCLYKDGINGDKFQDLSNFIYKISKILNRRYIFIKLTNKHLKYIKDNNNFIYLKDIDNIVKEAADKLLMYDYFVFYKDDIIKKMFNGTLTLSYHVRNLVYNIKSLFGDIENNNVKEKIYNVIKYFDCINIGDSPSDSYYYFINYFINYKYFISEFLSKSTLNYILKIIENKKEELFNNINLYIESVGDLIKEKPFIIILAIISLDDFYRKIFINYFNE